MGDSNTSILARLPVELISQVASYLNAEDFCSLRFASKAIEWATRGQFSLQYIQTMRFVMPKKDGRDGMQSLVDLSEHPDLSTGLQHVILASDEALFRTEPRLDFFTNIPDTYPQSTAELKATADKSSSFGAAGADRAMLAGVFSRLVNLKTIFLRDYTGPPRRTTKKDAYHLEPSLFFGPPIISYLFNEHMFAVTLAALADANARFENLEVVFAGAYALQDFAFYIPDDLEPSLTPVLSNLKKLDLTLAIWRLQDYDNDVPPCLAKFLSLTTNVSSLRLRFADTYGNYTRVPFLEWLGRQADPNVAEDSMTGAGGPVPANLPLLQRLELDHINHATPGALRNIVRKFGPTLHTLKLRRVILVEDHTAGNCINNWKPLLKFIANKTDLVEWSFSELTVSCPDQKIGIVCFPGDLIWGTYYLGPDAKATLRDVAGTMTVDWRPDFPTHMPDSDDFYSDGSDAEYSDAEDSDAEHSDEEHGDA